MVRAMVCASLVLAACGGHRVADVVARLPDRVLTGFDHPLAVVHDPLADVYLVAEGGGAGRGSVARITPAGQVQRGWIAGGPDGVLRSPRGLALAGEVLLVADGDAVQRFDRRSGRPLGAIAMPGVVAVDVAVGPDGVVWVADAGHRAEAPASGSPGLWIVLAGDRPERVPTGPELGEPRALVATTGGVYVATWDTGAFLLVDRAGHVEPLARAPQGSLAALCRPAPGRWLTVSRTGDALLAIDLQGGVRPIAELALAGAGDFGCDEVRRRLLVPLPDRGDVVLRGLPDPR